MKNRKLIRVGVLGACLGMAVVGNAQVAISNGPFQTHANGGFGNAPRSEVQTSVLLLNAYGFGCQKVAGIRLADDFVVPAGAKLRIQGITAYAYQSDATSNTINDCNFRIWNGAPNAGGSVVAGDPITNRFLSGTFTGVYRTDDLAGGATINTRMIMAIRANLVSSQILNSGTYWADWQLGGTNPSGPWNVPVTILGQTGKVGANALQLLGANWFAAEDEPALIPQDMAYNVIGSWIMNPLTVTPVQGLQFGGNLASLGASDNDVYVMLLDEFDSISNVEFGTTCPSATASRIDYAIELRASRNDLTQIVGFFNGSAWETVDVSTSSFADALRNVAIITNPQRFMLAGNALRSRIRTVPQADVSDIDGWTASTDWVQWEVTP